MAADEESESIRSLFDSAGELKRKLDQFPNSNSDEYQEILRQALAKYQKCKSFVAQASLFSLNESLEDLASSDIRYMTVDFHLGELTMKTRSGDRKATLEHARAHYRQFATLCEAYGLVPMPEKAALEKAADADSPGLSLPVDPAARRNAKIAQFKREKELKSKIETLSRSIVADDDDVRALHTSVISLAIMKTIQALEAVALELDLLAKAPPVEVPAQREEDGQRRAGKDDAYSDKLDIIGGPIKGGALLSKEGKPLRPFVLLDKREQLKNGVFRPSHNLPTMTIDEYLEEERARGGIIEGGGEKSGEKPEPNEDDYEAADLETMKARQWDEYKEEHPKGSGNTLNRG